MLLKTKKILVGVTAGVVATGTVLAITLPLTLGKGNSNNTSSSRSAIDNALSKAKTAKTLADAEKVFESIIIEPSGKASADSIGKYIFENKDKQTFKIVDTNENGINKVMIMAKATSATKPSFAPPGSPNVDNSVGVPQTWEDKELIQSNSDFGIVINMIDKIGYSVKLAGAAPSELIELVDAGQIALYSSLFNLKKNLQDEDIAKSISNNGAIKPSKVTGENFFNKAKLFPTTINKFIHDALKEAESAMKLTFNTSKKTNTSVKVEYEYMGLKGEVVVDGFKDDTSTSPADLVAEWKAKFATDLPAKEDAINKLPSIKDGKIIFNELNKVLATPIAGPGTNDGVTITMKTIVHNESTQKIKVDIVSTEDPSIKDSIDFTITGFVKQTDIDVKGITTIIVNTAITDKLGYSDMKEKDAGDALKKLNPSSGSEVKIDVNLSGVGNFKVTLIDLVANNASGFITYKYVVKLADNPTLSKDYKNDAESKLTGFKINKSDADLANDAKTVLDAIAQPILVSGKEKVDPSSVSSVGDAMREEYNKAGGNLVVKRADPTFIIKSSSVDSGEVTFTVEYIFGEKTVTKDITFSGFQTKKMKQQEDLKKDVDKFEANVPIEIALTGMPELNSIEANQKSINDILAKASKSPQIPAAENGVVRTYSITKNIEAGSASVEVTFTLGDIIPMKYKFTIKGFKTSAESDTADITADRASITPNNGPGKANAINEYKNGDTMTLLDINNLLETGKNIPDASNGVTRTYEVTSSAYAKKLDIKITFSKGSIIKSNEMTYSITGLQSQADFDVNGLSVAVNNKLKSIVAPTSEQDASKDKFPTDSISVNVGKTTFDVTIIAGKPEISAGEVPYTYESTAAGLTTDKGKGSGKITGFKVDLTPEQKKKQIQEDLDKIDSPFDASATLANKAPKDLSIGDVKILLDPKVGNKYTITPQYALGATKDGIREVTITYEVNDANIASRTIDISGLKSNAQIKKEQDAADVQTIKLSIKAIPGGIVINDKDGIASVTDKPLTKAKATDLKITIPDNIKDTTITYSHPAITSDGKLSITIKIVKGEASDSKPIEKDVTGIDKAKTDAADQKAINDTTASNITFGDKIDKDKLPSNATNAKPSNYDLPSGVKVEFTDWKQLNDEGKITWGVKIYKGSATPKELTGEITGFKKSVAIPKPEDITGVKAALDGTTLSGGKTPTNTEITLGSIASPGDKTVNVTVVPATGFIFSDGSSTKTLNGVAVDQTAYELASAKIQAKTELKKLYDEQEAALPGKDADVPVISPVIVELCKQAYIKAAKEVELAKDMAELQAKKTEQIALIKEDFAQYSTAINNANAVGALANAFMVITISSDKAIPAMPNKVKLDDAALKALGTVVGTFPANPSNATLEYKIESEITTGEGDLTVYIQIGADAAATTAKMTAIIKITVNPTPPPVYAPSSTQDSGSLY